MSVFRVILVRIFPHSDWIRGDTKYLFVFSPNAGKCGPGFLRIQIYFPAFGLNTGRYEVSLRIQSECRKMRARISPNTDTFYAVVISEMWRLSLICLRLFKMLQQSEKSNFFEELIFRPRKRKTLGKSVNCSSLKSHNLRFEQ